ncbi:pseudouridine synthase [Algivirga pacifica]|uniref:Pseudouridine synthase n=1 Tax=Algivirga pacifica TaxID=1162670 RepID=A0ABP9DFM9_9BACT
MADKKQQRPSSGKSRKSGAKPFEQFMKKKGTQEESSPSRGGGFSKKNTQRSAPKAKPKAHGSQEHAEAPSYNFAKIRQIEKEQQTADQLDKKRDGIRLNKYISNSGVCSRREADKLIEQGEITVNNEVVKELGYKVKGKDLVRYKGRVLKREKLFYVLLNKPAGFITTTKDPKERKTVMNLVKNACEERIYPVGRLDRATTGLLLFTNDGEFAKKMAHPSNETQKVYYVELNKPLSEEDEYTIRMREFELEDGPVDLDGLSVNAEDRRQIGIELHSGRNRIVRRIFEHFNYTVVKLDRTVLGGLTKKDLPRGKWRYLDEQELINLKYLDKGSRSSKKKKKR